MRHKPAPHDGPPESSYASQFASTLLDPARPSPALLTGPHGKAAARRYDIYRNNVTVSLIDALAAVYPCVLRITGEEFFRAMARFHIRETPPTSPLLFDYGRDFPAFIQRYAFAQAMPWLADTARIERAWLDAYHAADLAPLTAEALASVPPDRLAELTFVAHPATRIVRSCYAAVTIFAAHRDPQPVGTIDASAPEDALITRPDCDVVVRHLPPGGAEFLEALIAGAPLGEAAAAALGVAPSFDIGVGIAGMIAAGAFTALNHGDAA